MNASKAPPAPNAEILKDTRDQIANAIRTLQKVDPKYLAPDVYRGVDHCARDLVVVSGSLSRLERQLRAGLAAVPAPLAPLL